VAFFVFCLVGAVQEGLQRLTDDEESERTLIVFQENRFCPASSRLPEDYSRVIARVPGVEDSIPIQVWTNNCRVSLDIVVFNGVPVDKLRASREMTLLSGSWSDFESRQDGALVGQAIARRRGLSAGDSFTIGGLTVKVAGVFSSPSAAEENLIYTPLAFLQYSRGKEQAGWVSQHEVRLAKDANVEEAVEKINEALRAGSVPASTFRKGAFQASTLADLVDLIGFAHYLGFACIGLVLSLVATTTVMAVQDRVREHAVLQTLGVRPARIFRLVVAESMLQCAAGGAVGVAAALALLAFGGLAIGAEGVSIGFEPSWRLAAMGLGIAVAVGLLAGAVPAWQAARAHIVTALRAA
jgi:putative ABC transport system permease protein